MPNKSDLQLSSKFQELGVKIGPINGFTRKVYERKLRKLLSEMQTPSKLHIRVEPNSKTTSYVEQNTKAPPHTKPSSKTTSYVEQSSKAPPDVQQSSKVSSRAEQVLKVPPTHVELNSNALLHVEERNRFIFSEPSEILEAIGHIDDDQKADAEVMVAMETMNVNRNDELIFSSDDDDDDDDNDDDGQLTLEDAEDEDMDPTSTTNLKEDEELIELPKDDENVSYVVVEGIEKSRIIDSEIRQLSKSRYNVNCGFRNDSNRRQKSETNLNNERERCRSTQLAATLDDKLSAFVRYRPSVSACDRASAKEVTEHEKLFQRREKLKDEDYIPSARSPLPSYIERQNKSSTSFTDDRGDHSIPSTALKMKSSGAPSSRWPWFSGIFVVFLIIFVMVLIVFNMEPGYENPLATP